MVALKHITGDAVVERLLSALKVDQFEIATLVLDMAEFTVLVVWPTMQACLCLPALRNGGVAFQALS
jgi:hypothetical protein